MTTLDTPIRLDRPRTVLFGSGTLAQLGDWLSAHDYHRPFIVADPFLRDRLDTCTSPTCATTPTRSEEHTSELQSR